MIDRNSKILVTGATGFLGSYILRTLLKAGFQNVIGIRRKSSRMEILSDLEGRVEWRIGDILDVNYIAEHFEDIDYVIHTAALVDLDEGKRKQLFDLNITGTANVVNLCLEYKVKKLIHISSIAGLGRDSKIEVIDETKEWLPNPLNSTYGESKYLAELEIWRGMAEGLEVLILSPSLILGAGYWDRGTPGIIRKLEKGIPFYPAGSNGMVDVRDVAEATVLGLDSEVKNERIIISADNISYQYLFSQVSELLGKKPPRRKLNTYLAKVFLFFDWLKSKLTGSGRNMTGHNLLVLNAPSKYDNSKSIEKLQIKYRDFDQSLKDIAAAYKNTKGHFGLLKL